VLVKFVKNNTNICQKIIFNFVHLDNWVNLLQNILCQVNPNSHIPFCLEKQDYDYYNGHYRSHKNYLTKHYLQLFFLAF